MIADVWFWYWTPVLTETGTNKSCRIFYPILLPGGEIGLREE